MDVDSWGEETDGVTSFGLFGEEGSGELTSSSSKVAARQVALGSADAGAKSSSSVLSSTDLSSFTHSSCKMTRLEHHSVHP